MTSVSVGSEVLLLSQSATSTKRGAFGRLFLMHAISSAFRCPPHRAARWPKEPPKHKLSHCRGSPQPAVKPPTKRFLLTASFHSSKTPRHFAGYLPLPAHNGIVTENSIFANNREFPALGDRAVKPINVIRNLWLTVRLDLPSAFRSQGIFKLTLIPSNIYSERQSDQIFSGAALYNLNIPEYLRTETG